MNIGDGLIDTDPDKKEDTDQINGKPAKGTEMYPVGPRAPAPPKGPLVGALKCPSGEVNVGVITSPDGNIQEQVHAEYETSELKSCGKKSLK